MRNDFSKWMEQKGALIENLVFLTGDLGFNALENVQKVLGPRFVNVGVSEQNMVSMAASMAHEGLQVVCYSIAPFIAFRPAEQIRLDVCLHNKNVKFIGNGGGYGYGIMGATHHAIEDLSVLSSFQNMRCFVPMAKEDVASICDEAFAWGGPAYIRLGVGLRPEGFKYCDQFRPVEKLSEGKDVLIIGIGPVLINGMQACKNKNVSAAFYKVSELPFVLTKELAADVARIKKIVILEENVRRGGLGEFLALELLKQGLNPKIEHLCAQGYPSQTYGSQKFHQAESSLDPTGIISAVGRICHE